MVRDFKYSRYADDITISGSYELPLHKERIIKIINESGFEINSKKVRMLSKGSRQTVVLYTQHQLLVLVLLKEYISRDYRDFVELIDLMSNIKDKLDLAKVPHYTTLQKFVSRVPFSFFNLICQEL